MRMDTEKLLVDMRSLKPGINTGEFPIYLNNIQWEIDNVEPAEDRGLLRITVDLEDTAVLCTGNLRAEFRTPCARCLEPAVFPVDEAVERKYTWDPGLSGEDVHLIPASGELDILDAVREAVILSVPGKPLCSPHCPGIDYN